MGQKKLRTGANNIEVSSNPPKMESSLYSDDECSPPFEEKNSDMDRSRSRSKAREADLAECLLWRVGWVASSVQASSAQRPSFE